MFKKCLVMVLIALVFNLADAGLVLAQTQDDKNAQLTKEIKAKIAKIGTGEKSKVKIELHDKTKLKGFVSAIEAESFTVTDKETGSTTTIEYAQAKKANRQGITLGSKIALAGLAAGATIILLLWRSYYCNEQAC